MRLKVSGIFLLISLAAPLATSYTFYYLQKWVIRKEVKTKILAGMPKDSLVCLKLGKVEARLALDWEHDKEFTYQDQKYDVIETIDLGDSIAYWCWWDHKETHLSRRLDKLLELANSSNPYQQKSQKRLVQFFNSLYCTELPYYTTNQPIYQSTLVMMDSLFTCWSSKPLTPPPQSV